MTALQIALAVPAVVLGAAVLILAESMIGGWAYRRLESQRLKSRNLKERIQK